MSRANGGRGYPTAEIYEEREREFYGGGRRPYVQEYEELDVDISRGQRMPDYLREGYGRTSAGPLVMRERAPQAPPPPAEIARVSRSRRPAPRDYGQDYVEEEELLVTRKSRRNRDRDEESSEEASSGRGAPSARGGRREEIDIDIREERRGGRPRREDIEVDIRQQQYNRERQRQRNYEEIDIDIRQDDQRSRRDYDEEITFRRGTSRPRGGEREEEAEPPRRAKSVRAYDDEVEVDIRRDRPRARDGEREEIDVNIRRGERSQSRPRIIAREREEFIYKRREPSPPPIREIEKIVIRRPRTPSPEPEPSPSPSPSPEREPSPELEPIKRPPIIQEIITHHRHIDHGNRQMVSLNTQSMLIWFAGVVRAPRSAASSSSSSSSPSPPPVKRRPRELEIDIRRKCVLTKLCD